MEGQGSRDTAGMREPVSALRMIPSLAGPSDRFVGVLRVADTWHLFAEGQIECGVGYDDVIVALAALTQYIAARRKASEAIDRAREVRQ